LNPILEKLGARFQLQAHDHVLSEEERERTAFENAIEYIARNPERAGLVKEGNFREYPYMDCLIPGYPELKLWQHDYWQTFWRIYASLREHGLVRYS
jgi:putative transposase